jgi:hypothetical protein
VGVLAGIVEMHYGGSRNREGRPVSTDYKPGKRELVGFLGIGLDDKDGHQRLTRTEHFFLLGGSEETHERMQDTAIRFNESLRHRGKALQTLSPDEVLDLLREAMDE